MAKEGNYASRAVYKLQEIDKRFNLIASGHKILDLGCRPGSWLQYAAKKVGPKGMVVGVDLKDLEISLPANTHVFVEDVREIDPAKLEEKAGGLFHGVLSDMAPNTTGIRCADVARSLHLLEAVLLTADRVLRTDGFLAAKIFQGQGFDETLYEVKRRFKKVKNMRPEGTRKGSMELYVVGIGKRETPLSLK